MAFTEIGYFKDFAGNKGAALGTGLIQGWMREEQNQRNLSEQRKQQLYKLFSETKPQEMMFKRNQLRQSEMFNALESGLGDIMMKHTKRGKFSDEGEFAARELIKQTQEQVAALSNEDKMVSEEMTEFQKGGYNPTAMKDGMTQYTKTGELPPRNEEGRFFLSKNPMELMNIMNKDQLQKAMTSKKIGNEVVTTTRFGDSQTKKARLAEIKASDPVGYQKALQNIFQSIPQEQQQEFIKTAQANGMDPLTFFEQSENGLLSMYQPETTSKKPSTDKSGDNSDIPKVNGAWLFKGPEMVDGNYDYFTKKGTKQNKTFRDLITVGVKETMLENRTRGIFAMGIEPKPNTELERLTKGMDYEDKADFTKNYINVNKDKEQEWDEIFIPLKGIAGRYEHLNLRNIDAHNLDITEPKPFKAKSQGEFLLDAKTKYSIGGKDYTMVDLKNAGYSDKEIKDFINKGLIKRK